MFLPKIWIICRVCLKQQEEMFNIFDDMVNKSIWSMLRDCGGVPVRRNDNLPDKICDACLRRLCKANTFRIDCQRGHRELVQLLMERNFNMYEIELEEEKKYCTDVISISDTKDNYPVSSYIAKLEPQNYEEFENSENLADPSNEETTIQTEKPNENIKQYCVVSKNNNAEEEIVETTKANKSNSKEPIVLLLKLKNKAQVKNQLETINTTDPPTNTSTIRKLETMKQPPTKGSNKTDTEIANEKVKLKTKTIIAKAKFTCKVCKKIFKTYTLLRHHMYIHDRPHKCKICKKSFSQIQAFLCHNNQHTGEKPYNCRFCNKTYSDISNRNSHERKLHNKPIYKCAKCNKQFRLLILLQKHTQCHRPKKCFICNKEFGTLQMVRIHHRQRHLKLLNE